MGCDACVWQTGHYGCGGLPLLLGARTASGHHTSSGGQTQRQGHVDRHKYRWMHSGLVKVDASIHLRRGYKSHLEW